MAATRKTTKAKAPVPDVQDAVAEMARQVQALTAALAARPAELEERVAALAGENAALQAEAAALRAEREHLLRLKALYERKFEAMKPKG